MKSFEFVSMPYATEFARRNMKALVNVDPALMHAVRGSLAEEQRSLQLLASNLQHASEDALVATILADIEKGRGPAARRAAMERGLSKLTRQDLRQQVLLEAARIETRAVLDKVDSLKSNAAKRRHLEEGIAALRADSVPDELQRREIEVLEAALREIE